MYFIVRKLTEITCNKNEDLINGICVSKCEGKQYCDKNGITCNKNSYCSNTNICCPQGQQCDEITNTCKVCDHELCNGICCDYSSGYTCNPNTKKCELACPNINNINDDIYKCDGLTANMPTEIKYCKDKEMCIHNCDDKTFSCIDKKNCWDTISYTPGLLTSTYGDDHESNYIYNNKYVNVCQSTGPIPTNWIYSSDTNLINNIHVNKSSYYNEKNCDTDSCINKIINDGDILINDLNPSVSNTNINKGLCTFSRDCTQILLNQSDMTNLCNTLDTDTNNKGRCCKTQDNYTGQICNPGKVCIKNDNSDNICVDYTYCLNGKLNPDKRLCDCDPKYSGNPCKPMKWNEYYNDNWVKDYIMLIKKYTDVVDNYFSIFPVAIRPLFDDDYFGKDKFWIIRINCDDNSYNLQYMNNYSNLFLQEMLTSIKQQPHVDQLDSTYADFSLGVKNQDGIFQNLINNSVISLNVCKINTNEVNYCLDLDQGQDFFKNVYWKFYPFSYFGINFFPNILIFSQYLYTNKTVPITNNSDANPKTYSYSCSNPNYKCNV